MTIHRLRSGRTGSPRKPRERKAEGSSTGRGLSGREAHVEELERARLEDEELDREDELIRQAWIVDSEINGLVLRMQRGEPVGERVAEILGRDYSSNPAVLGYQDTLRAWAAICGVEL